MKNRMTMLRMTRINNHNKDDDNDDDVYSDYQTIAVIFGTIMIMIATMTAIKKTLVTTMNDGYE